MKWLKDVVIDLIVTMLIAVAVFGGFSWALWIVWIYTPLMLVLKALAFFSVNLQTLTRKQGPAPPAWFFHLLYGVNEALLAYGRLWVLAGLWIAIWVFSAGAGLRRPKVSPGKR